MIIVYTKRHARLSCQECKADRWCFRCQKHLPKTSFAKRNNVTDGLQLYCRDCGSIIAKENKIKNPEKWKESQHKCSIKRKDKIKDWTLKSKFGITKEQYDEMLKRQGGVCAICKTISQGRDLDVDHDHKTGKIRKLLCRNCNMGLGYFKDNYELLNEASKYLRESD